MSSHCGGGIPWDATEEPPWQRSLAAASGQEDDRADIVAILKAAMGRGGLHERQATIDVGGDEAPPERIEEPPGTAGELDRVGGVVAEIGA